MKDILMELFKSTVEANKIEKIEGVKNYNKGFITGIRCGLILTGVMVQELDEIEKEINES
jgi:hypothetical protein